MIGEICGLGLLVKLIMDVVICGLLGQVAVIDWKKQIIPDKLNLAIFLVGAMYVVILPIGFLLTDTEMSYEGSFRAAAVGRIIGMIVLPGLMLVANFFIKGAFGGGDVKLSAALGMAYGFINGGTGILLGILISGFCGMILLITGKKKMGDRFALGPFLATGMIVVIAEFWIELAGGSVGDF